MIEWIHPGAAFFISAALTPFVRGRARAAAALTAPAVAGLLLWLQSPGLHGVVSFLGRELIVGRVDPLSRVFGVIFVIMAAVGLLYALQAHARDAGQQTAALTYVGGALGAVFGGDLLTVFIFSEVMAFSSVFLIWARREAKSLAAGFRYLLVHIFAGVCLLGGIVLQLIETGSLVFDRMSLAGLGLGPGLILLGFMINAAVPPLSAWLSDAYPEATVTGAVFLSAFTTKTAVYLLIRGFAGTELLVWMGAVMTVYGVVYAMLENDIRRLLAYHIISQVGYMVCGVGIGTELALNGSTAHAFAHILYKGLLFMGAGAVMEMTGKRKMTELGGLYKTMPWTMILYLIAGFSISGVPLFSGFISKSMVVSAAAEDHRVAVWGLLMLASSGTFLSTTLKWPYAVFFGTDAGIAASDPPWNMRWAMGLAAGLCVLLGVWPELLYGLLPYGTTYHPYTGGHVIEALSILGFTALGFFLLLPKLHPEATISLDTDWFYRKGARGLLWLAAHPIARADAAVGEAYLTFVLNPFQKLGRFLGNFDDRVIDGAVNGVGRGTQAFAWLATTTEKYVIYGSLNIIGYGNHIAARVLRRIQSGQVHHYAAFLVIGIFILLNLYLWFVNDNAVFFFLGRLPLSGKN